MNSVNDSRIVVRSSLLTIDYTQFPWMLLFVPLCFISKWLELDPLLVFFISGLAIIPLATAIANATENIAGTLGSTMGGLLNATFGNITEMAISIVALSKDLAEVVKASISGAIITNLLLGLGLGMFLGGLKHTEQHYHSRISRINSSSLNLGLVVLLTPSAMLYTSPEFHVPNIGNFSIIAATLLLGYYLLSLLFSMKTHRHIFELDLTDSKNGGTAELIVGTSRQTLIRQVSKLAITSVILLFVSEVLVDSLEGAIHSLGLTPLFTGVILLPLFGGVVEYIAVITFARKDKMDLAVSVAMGSSLQIALFVAPILVLVGHFIGHPLDLGFRPFELLAVMVAVFLTNSISTDGRSNWLEGILLIVTYAVIAVAFYYHP